MINRPSYSTYIGGMGIVLVCTSMHFTENLKLRAGVTWYLLLGVCGNDLMQILCHFLYLQWSATEHTLMLLYIISYTTPYKYHVNLIIFITWGWLPVVSGWCYDDDDYLACEIQGPIGLCKGKLNSFLCHIETSKLAWLPQQSHSSKTQTLCNLAFWRSSDSAAQCWDGCVKYSRRGFIRFHTCTVPAMACSHMTCDHHWSYWLFLCNLV